MSLTPMATCETALIGIALSPPAGPCRGRWRQAATAIAAPSTAGGAAKQPDPDRAGEIGRIGAFDSLRVDPRDQRAECAALLVGGALQRLPENRLEPERGGMAGNRQRALDQ